MKEYKKNGYTLVELLAVIFILVAVGTIISSILTSVLRSSNKSTNIELVRVNGNNAIAQMSRMIGYAQKLEGISVTGNFSNPTQYQTDCTAQASQLTHYKYIQIKSFDGGITTFECLGTEIASQSSTSGITYLVDPTLLNTKTCYFQCSQESTAAPAKIDIFLELTTKVVSLFSEAQADIPFETSIIIRNNGSR